MEKSALKSGNVTEGYIDRLAKAEDVDKFLADDLKIRRGVYEKFRRNVSLLYLNTLSASFQKSPSMRDRVHLYVLALAFLLSTFPSTTRGK